MSMGAFVPLIGFLGARYSWQFLICLLVIETYILHTISAQCLGILNVWYKVAIKPIWTYGIELWGCASKTNIAIIQRLQLKILRAMTNAPWYVSNDTLHNDLVIPIISDVIEERSNKHHNRLETNSLMQPLLEQPNYRRLKRRLPIDLKWISGGSFGGRVPILSLSGLLALG
jgi:hypothetical protein